MPDHDPQRVCVLQGPVSVRYNTTTDQTAKEILDGIYDGWSRALLDSTPVESLPAVDYLTPETDAPVAKGSASAGASASGSAAGSAPTTPGRRGHAGAGAAAGAAAATAPQQSPQRSVHPWSVETGDVGAAVLRAVIPGDSGAKLHDTNTAEWLELLGDSSRAG